ncbi:CAAX prenyl protease [Pseudoscourfieldia marina]
MGRAIFSNQRRRRRKKESGDSDDNDQDREKSLRLLDADMYATPFAAPFSPVTIVGGLVAFAVAYPLSGAVFAPWVGQHVVGLPPLTAVFATEGDALLPVDEATRALWRVQYAFVGQALETSAAVAGTCVLARLATKLNEEQQGKSASTNQKGASSDNNVDSAPLFQLDLSPFGPSAWNLRDGWLTWAIIGYPLAVASVSLASVVTIAVTDGQGFGGRGTADDVVQLLKSSPKPVTSRQEQAANDNNAAKVTNAPSPRSDMSTAVPPVTPANVASVQPTWPYLLGIASFLAPASEELIFRGFLLASLTRFMSPTSAAFASAGAFACAHLSARDLPQLWGLGMVLGLSYVRTKNLATPIAIHSTWNAMTLLLLVVVQMEGGF